MDSETREMIIEELTEYLNRVPTEQEIMNSQTDTRITAKVEKRKDDAKISKMQTDITSFKNK